MQTTVTQPEALVAAVNAAPATPAPAKAKRTRKPKAAKPSKPAEPKANADRERCLANRAIVAPHYSGASPTSHATRPPKLTDALQRIATPVQRAKSATTRDESALALCLAHADKSGTFCPVAATADLGALSRLASLGLIATSGTARARLTKAGRDLANIVAKRAA